LFLTYEQLSRDLEGCIRKIAAFIGMELPRERLLATVERSSFDFMKAHEPKFDPALELLWEQGVQLKSFLGNGKVGDGTVRLSESHHARFDSALGRRLAKLGIPVVANGSPTK